MKNIFTDRIDFNGDLADMLKSVSISFNIGDFIEFEIIEIGYEDLNIKLTTSKGTYLVKIFGKFRDWENIERYVGIMKSVVESGIAHPKLYKANNDYLFRFKEEVSLCVMDYVEGKSFYDLNARPTLKEAEVLIAEAGKINSLNIKPDDYYDEWSPVNLVNEFKLKSSYLSSSDLKRVKSVVNEFSSLEVGLLPEVFVHGDIIRPNVLKDKDGKIYIIDYSCASLKPRVQELAILICGMFFNEEDPTDFKKYYDLVVEKYQPELTGTEKEALMVFVKAGFSMYVMQGIYTKVVKGIDHKENDYWISLGQEGLKFLIK